MTIIIVPDIHNNYEQAETIIESEGADQVVLLGDYFDNFGEEIDSVSNTALWLSNSLKKKNRIHLIGNHDLSYMTKNRQLKCSGYNDFKMWSICQYMRQSDWDKLVFHYWIDDWLCTHAGVSRQFFEAYSEEYSIKDFMRKQEQSAKLALSKDTKHIFFNVSDMRGGHDLFSGILWCDYSEFTPIPNVKQIFGHTADDEPRIIKDVKLSKLQMNTSNVCLDTHLNYYGIYDGELKIKSTHNKLNQISV